MRSFLLALDTATSDDTTWDARADRWLRALPEAPTRAEALPGFRCLLFGKEDADIRLLWSDAAAGRVNLAQGPRLGRDADGEIRGLPRNAPAEWSARPDLHAEGRENSIFASYRAEGGGSLLLKTSLLNSLFVYRLELDGTLFLSDSSALLQRIARAKIDPLAAAELVSTGTIYGNKSLFAGIATLKPSRLYLWTRGAPEETREYWNIEKVPFDSLPLRDGVESLVSVMDGTFARLKASGKPFVLDLTGGYDSRCNLACALRAGLPARLIVSGPPDSPDVVIAKRIARAYGRDLTNAERLAPGGLADVLPASARCTDMEYDLVEYANILHIHTQYYSQGEISVHGSTADVMRNYFLLPGFYRPDPEGEVDLDALVAKKFLADVDPARFFRASLGLDWPSHMRSQIALYDRPELPAFARLDVIYLRIRMQFWQGRISSSTNRIHPSFSPWTNLPALEAILSIRWKEKRSAMLSRAFLSRIGQGLDRFPLAGPGAAGVGLPAALRGWRNTAAFYAGRVRQKAFPRPVASGPGGNGTRETVRKRAAALEPWLSPEAVRGIAAGEPLSGPVAGRLLTLIKAAEWTGEG